MKIKQLSVFVENKTGRINEVTQILGSNGVNMTAFSLADSGEFGILRMIVSDVGRAVSALKEARFGISVTEVVCFCCPNEPGALFHKFAFRLLIGNVDFIPHGGPPTPVL